METWSITTRLLHLGIAVTVPVQLFLSLFMRLPKVGRPESFRTLLFEFHEFFGLMALFFILVHWLWMLRSRDAGRHHLFPYRSEGRGRISADLKKMLTFNLPEGGPGAGGLVGMVHGLGFLAATGMAVSGGIIFLSYTDALQFYKVGGFFREIHEGIAPLVWIYLVGHVGMVVVHHIAGHDTLRRMFFLSKKTP